MSSGVKADQIKLPLNDSPTATQYSITIPRNRNEIVVSPTVPTELWGNKGREKRGERVTQDVEGIASTVSHPISRGWERWWGTESVMEDVVD